MHKFAKQIMDCVKAHVDGIGIENFEGQNLDDLKDWTEIAKNIVCFDKEYNIKYNTLYGRYRRPKGASDFSDIIK